jgi:hypothetical protein
MNLNSDDGSKDNNGDEESSHLSMQDIESAIVSRMIDSERAE